MHHINPLLMMPTEAHLRIQEKIAHHLECIRDLKSQQNALAPISKLPFEVIGAIFYFVSAGRRRASPIFPCYNFTHVSRSWRSVALNTPNLWQVLPLSEAWQTIILERSKGTGLVVEETFSSFPTPSNILFLKDVLAQHASHIRVLDLSWFKVLPPNSLFGSLSRSSLRPYSLKLTIHLREGVEKRATFPGGVLEAGNLRTLDIHCYDGPWYSLSTPALTNLKLHNIPTRPPLTKFLDMLRGLATLNVLDMKNSLPLADDRVTGLIDPIHLPNLRSLCLHSTSNPKEVTNILPLIIVPPTATLSLIVQDDQYEITITQETLDESVLSLSTFLGQLYKVAVYPTAICVYSPESHYLRLKVWSDEKNKSTPDLTLILDLDTPPTSTPAQSLLRRIFPSLPWSNITTLTLQILPVRSLLEDIFGRIPCLRDVKVVGRCTIEFIQALTRKPDNAGPSTVLFPALQSLHISAYSFKGYDLSIADLQGCLKERRKQRVGLLKLKLTDCPYLWRKEVKSLRQIVSDVEWCGRSQDSDSDSDSDEYI